MSKVIWVLFVAGFSAIAADTSGSTGAVTFNKHVLPILQKNCQSCHRPGQVAPMSFLTYESARPWAKAMKSAVVSKTMPPWSADPQVGHFSNDRSLKPADIELIAKWADTGAAQGDAKDAPLAIDWAPNGWQIKPEVVVKGPDYNVPAKGLVEWMWVVIPGPFKEDTWVTSVELRPTQVSVSHHMCLAFRPHTPDVEYGRLIWQDKARDANGDEIDDRKSFGGGGGGGAAPALPQGPPPANTIFGILGPSNGIEECYEPGRQAADFRPYRAAKLIPAGTDIAVNMHYTPNGTPVTASFEVGFTVAKAPPERRYLALSASAPQSHDQFAIPPNDPNWESPPADVVFDQNVELVGLMPHMHVRGKSMSFELIYPDGKKEEILNVPKYDFNWQIWYDTSIKVPKGTKLHVVAHYDNSVNNKYNPNPNKTVYYGDMTWDEMMFPSFGVVVEDKSLDQRKVLRRGPPPGVASN